MEQDNRESALRTYLNNITEKKYLLTSKILELKEFEIMFDDYVLHNKGEFDDVCKKFGEMAKPIIEKCKQALKLKAELLEWDIKMEINLGHRVLLE